MAKSWSWSDVDLRLTGAAIATGALFNVSGWLTPQLTQGAIDRFHLSAGMAGLIPTCENLLSAAVCMLVTRFWRADKLRKLSVIALVIWFFANFSTFLVAHFTTSVAPLLIVRAVAGTATGMLLFISTTLATATARPERSFGFIIIAANTYVALGLTTLSSVFRSSGNFDVYPYLALIGLIWVPLTLWQPSFQAAKPNEGAPARRTSLKLTRFQIAAFVVGMNAPIFMSLSNFIFCTPAGLRAGLTASQVQVALGWATMASTCGALAASALPRTWGKATPLAICFTLAIATNYIYGTTNSSILFVGGLAASQVLGFFWQPVILAWSVDYDPSGATANIMNSASVVMYALCPAFVGTLLDQFGSGVLQVLTVSMCGAGLICVAILSRTPPQSAPPSEAAAESLQ